MIILLNFNSVTSCPGPIKRGFLFEKWSFWLFTGKSFANLGFGESLSLGPAGVTFDTAVSQSGNRRLPLLADQWQQHTRVVSIEIHDT